MFPIFWKEFNDTNFRSRYILYKRIRCGEERPSRLTISLKGMSGYCVLVSP